MENHEQIPPQFLANGTIGLVRGDATKPYEEANVPRRVNLQMKTKRLYSSPAVIMKLPHFRRKPSVA